MKRPVEERLKVARHGSASDAVHRIIPLGLTLGEARAWYVNHIIIPRLRWALLALVTGFVILVCTGFGQWLEQSLVTRMIVHDSLLIVAGFLFAYCGKSLIEMASHVSERVWRGFQRVSGSGFAGNAVCILSLLFASSLVGYWYLPTQFNATAVSVVSSAEMDLALLLAGSLIFVGACSLTRRLKLIGLVVVGKALGLYGMFLILTTQTVYPLYPAYEQVYAGAALLFSMLILDFTVMPVWLYNYFGRGQSSHVATNTTRSIA